jgi:hypothetical protein
MAASVEHLISKHPLLADPRSWCIGRFVLDRPAHSELSAEEYEYTGDKIDVTSNVSHGTFQHKVDMRANELRAKKRTVSLPLTAEMMRNGNNGIKEIDTPWLEQAVSPNSFSRLLIYKQYGDAPDLPLDGEGYVLAGSNMLAMKFMLGSRSIQNVIRDESEWYRNVSYRDNWTVPAERGFCINGALIGGPSRNSEVATQTIVLQPGRPSAFVIRMRDAVDGDQQGSLLKTLPDLRGKLRAQGNVHVLREGKRQLAGMDAEEVLFSITEGGVRLFRFYLLAPGNPDTVAQPHTDIQLILGATNDSTLTPEQASSPVDEAGAIQIWDTLLNSMRLRPGAM